MNIEFRVIWKRVGHKQKAKRYSTRKGAERFMALFGPTPWKVYAGRDAEADDLMCCRGHECACGGMTNKEHSDAEREKMPELVYVKLESRFVGKWKGTEEEKARVEPTPTASVKGGPCQCLRCIRDRKETIGGLPVEMCRMILCQKCGNKRCPHSDWHGNECTNSNESGQPGSRYP